MKLLIMQFWCRGVQWINGDRAQCRYLSTHNELSGFMKGALWLRSRISSRTLLH
jgi:hypothetical protein